MRVVALVAILLTALCQHSKSKALFFFSRQNYIVHDGDVFLLMNFL